jgi:hypothetical protein
MHCRSSNAILDTVSFCPQLSMFPSTAHRLFIVKEMDKGRVFSLVR